MEEKETRISNLVRIFIVVILALVSAFLVGCVFGSLEYSQSAFERTVYERIEIDVDEKLTEDELSYLGSMYASDIILTKSGIAHFATSRVFFALQPGRQYCVGIDTSGMILQNYGYAPCQ